MTCAAVCRSTGACTKTKVLPRLLLAGAGCALLCAAAVAGTPALADEASVSPGTDAAAVQAVAPEPVDLSGAGNVDIATAASVSFGQQVNDFADGMGTRKYYRVDLPASGRLTIDSTVPWEGLWGQETYRLIDEAGTTLWTYDCRSDWNETTQQSHSVLSIDLTGGTYYLVVGEDEVSGAYGFSLSFADAGESVQEAQGGSNNALATATPVELGVPYTGQTAINDDVDFYAFSLPTAGRISLDAVLTWDCGWDTTYRIFDPAGNELWTYEGRNDWNDTTAQAVTSQSVDLTAGSYYLSVSYSGNDAYGPYTFTLGFEDAAESAPEAQGGSNNELASAVPVDLGRTQRAQLALNDAVDFFSFEMPEAGVAHLDVTASWRTYGDAMFLYDASGNELWSFDNGGDWNDQLGYASSAADVELEAGTYYFAVQSDDDDVKGPYEFCWFTDAIPRQDAGGLTGAGQQAAEPAEAPSEGEGGSDDAAADPDSDAPCADGTYTASLEGANGLVEMTVGIEGGLLTAVDVTSEGGVEPGEYADLFASCLDQARAAGSSSAGAGAADASLSSTLAGAVAEGVAKAGAANLG